MAKKPAAPDRSPAVLLFEAYLREKTPKQKLIAFSAVLDWYSHHFTNLTREEILIFSQTSFILKNMFDISVSLKKPEDLPVELSKAILKLSAIISQTEPLPDSFVPPTLDALLADLAVHNADIQKTLARQEGIPESGLSDFEKLVTRLTGLSGSDETGRAIAFTTAVQIIAEKKLSPDEISAVLGEKMVAAGQKPPPPTAIAAVTPEIVTETRELITAAQKAAPDRPEPTPPVPEPTRPPITAGAPPPAQIIQTIQELHQAKEVRETPVYTPRQSYERDISAAVAPILAAKVPKHLHEKAGQVTAQILSQEIQRQLASMSQGDMSRLTDLLEESSFLRMRLQAEVSRKLGITNFNSEEFTEAIRAAAEVALPAGLQHEGLYATPGPVADTSAYEAFPGHALWQPNLFFRWVKFQVADFGAESLKQEIQQTQQLLNTQLTEKTNRVREIEDRLAALESHLAKLPASEKYLTQNIRAEIDRLRINRADAERSAAVTAAENQTFKLRSRVWEDRLLVEDFDREIHEAAARGDTALAKKIAAQREAVYRATHEQTATEVQIPMKEWQLLGADLRQAGFDDESPALKIVNELLEKKQGLVSIDQINELDRLVTEAEINQGLPRPFRLKKIRGLFDRKLPFYQHIEDARARLQASFAQQPAFISKIIYRVTGGRWSSTGHLLHGLYNRTLGPLAAAFKSSKLGLWLSGKAAAYSFKGLGLKTGLSTLIGKIMTKAGLSAVGAATGPVGWVATALTFVYDAGKWLIRKAKDALSYFQRKPAAALIPLGILSLLAPPIGLPLLLLTGGLLFFTGKHPFFGSGLSGFAGNLVDFFTALLIISSGEKIAQFILILIGGLALSTLLVFIVVAAAFIVPIKPEDYQPPSQAYFTVTKTVSDRKIDIADLPASVSYQFTVTAIQEIIITGIRDTRTVSCQNEPPVLKQPEISLPFPSEPVTTYVYPEKPEDYTLEFNNSYQNCRVCNTVDVSANLADGTASGLRASGSVCVEIGDPPDDCPSIWPTDHGTVTQGPAGDYSHITPDGIVLEAIDISDYRLKLGESPIYSTHQGQVSVHTDPNNGYGRYVDVNGICNGKAFATRYAHLDSITVRQGQIIPIHTQVGFLGNSGIPRKGGIYSTHLHYEFRPINPPILMVTPYVPVTIPRGCHFDCGISW